MPSPLQSSFAAWRLHQQQVGRLRYLASVKVYQAMWTALADWCGRQAVQPPLQALDGALLQRYLDSRSGMAGPGQALTPRYRLRLLSLVRRVQAHAMARQDGRAAGAMLGTAAHHPRSAAAKAWAEASLAAGPALSMVTPDAPASLSAALTGGLMTWLGQAPGDARASRWQAWRDRCAVALQLGAGLGPGDLRALRLADLLRPGGSPADAAAAAGPHRPLDCPPAGPGALGWWLCVPANGNAPAYRAPVAAWAAALLQQWLACRAQQGLPGPMLFPATRSGKPWGKVAQYGAVRQALIQAGLPDGPGGSFRLRHTFALRQLVRGHDADTVAAWLGVSDPHVMQRYRQALGAALIDHAAHGLHGRLTESASPAPCWPV